MSEETTVSEDPSWQVQKAIYKRLRAVFGEDMTIVDNVEAAEFEGALPFILIGDDTLVDNFNQITGDFTVKALIRCHAAGPSRKDTKELAHKVRMAMSSDPEADRSEIDVEHFQSTSYHSGTQTALVEGVAHVAIVEWTFDLLEDIE